MFNIVANCFLCSTLMLMLRPNWAMSSYWKWAIYSLKLSGCSWLVSCKIKKTW